jgi:hypothetical protein
LTRQKLPPKQAFLRSLVSYEAAREFLTTQGLGAPGAVSVFRVYVVTATGNEKGSNTAQITRPA